MCSWRQLGHRPVSISWGICGREHPDKSPGRRMAEFNTDDAAALRRIIMRTTV
jgi:hypothetical protein